MILLKACSKKFSFF